MIEIKDAKKEQSAVIARLTDANINVAAAGLSHP